MKKTKRVFSLEEANGLIPELEKRLRSLQAKKANYTRAHDSLLMHELVCEAEKREDCFEETGDLETNIHALEEAVEAFAQDVQEILVLGCILRDFEHGWVEFLGKYEGKKVYFSWRQGEPSIQFIRFCEGDRKVRMPLQTKVQGRHK